MNETVRAMKAKQIGPQRMPAADLQGTIAIRHPSGVTGKADRPVTAVGRAVRSLS